MGIGITSDILNGLKRTPRMTDHRGQSILDLIGNDIMVTKTNSQQR